MSEINLSQTLLLAVIEADKDGFRELDELLVTCSDPR